MTIPVNVHSIDDVRKALAAVARNLDQLTALAGAKRIEDLTDVDRNAATRFQQKPVEDDLIAWDVKANAWIYQNAAEAGLTDFFNGTFAESFHALATSNGATITMSLEQAGGGDLRMLFTDDYSTFVCTPAATVPLTAGTDEIPVENFVYILQSDKILTVSTSGWPAPEHIRVGHFVVPSATWVQTYGGTYGNQNHNDHAKETAGDSIGQGHMTDLSSLGRLGGATWLSGCAGTATESGNDLYISVAAGVVQQVHKHVFTALNSDPGSTGDPFLVVNDFDTKYLVADSLNDIDKLSDGTLIGNNKYVKFVLIGVASKEGELQLMLVNVPSGQYNTIANATRDVDGHANFTIPAAFGLNASTGFLIAAFVCKHTASAMEIEDTIDLRGTTPATAPGSGTGGGDVSAAAAMTDNAVIRGAGGAKDVQDSGVLIDDSDNMSGIGNLTLSGTVDGVDIAARDHAESHTVASHSDTSAAGSELDTLTDGSNADALHVHTKLRTFNTRIYIELPRAVDIFPLNLNTAQAITITEIYAKVDAVTSVTFNLYWRTRAALFTVPGTLINTSPIVATTSGVTTTSFDDATIPADAEIFLDASAVSATPTKLMCIVEATID